jgi:transcriptional regulator with XRE-family HTH domain
VANKGAGVGQMAVQSRLKYVLLDKEMKVKDLAERIGTDPAQVSHWATGRRLPTLERAIQIAEALEVPVEQIWKRV